MHWFIRICYLNGRIDINCGRKDDRQAENRTSTSHLGKVGATETKTQRTFNIDKSEIFEYINPITEI